METFAKLFGSLVVSVYHCFDRMVILGHLPLLTQPEPGTAGIPGCCWGSLCVGAAV